MGILNNKFFVLNSNFNGSSDPFRQLLERYWVQKGDSISLQKTTTQALPFDLSLEREDSMDLTVSLEPSGLTYKFPTTYEEIVIIPKESSLATEAERLVAGASPLLPTFQSFFNELENMQDTVNGTTFEDYVFDLNAPIIYPSKYDNNSLIQGSVNFVYNYGFGKYENLIAPSDFKEIKILNYYNYFQNLGIVTPSKASFNHYLESVDFIPDHPLEENYFITSLNYKDAMNLEDSMEDKNGNKLAPFYGLITFLSPNKRGFTERGDSASGTRGSTEADSSAEESTTSTSDSASGAEGSTEADSSGISITTIEPLDPVDAVLNKEQRLFAPISSYCSDLLAPEGASKYFIKKDFNNSNLLPEYTNVNEQTNFEEIFSVESNKLNMINIFDMIDNLYISEAVNPAPQTKGFYRNASSEAQIATKDLSKGENDGFKNALQGALQSFLGEVQEKSNNNIRTYVDILNGVPSYQSDIVFYRIAKFDATADGPDSIPIQNIWIPGNNDFNKNKIVNYIDTQVKYGKRYTYKVFAYKFVIGTEYSYKIEDENLLPVDDDVDEKADVDSLVTVDDSIGDKLEFFNTLKDDFVDMPPEIFDFASAMIDERLAAGTFLDTEDLAAIQEFALNTMVTQTAFDTTTIAGAPQFDGSTTNITNLNIANIASSFVTVNSFVNSVKSFNKP